MNKINLETFKKLLNVKKGGAEFFRLVVKILVWMIALGAVLSVIYSLNEIQNTEKEKFNLEIAKVNLDTNKVKRVCELKSRNTLSLAINQAKKEKKEVTKTQEKEFFVNTYNECVYLEGMDWLIQKIEKKEVKEEIKK